MAKAARPRVLIVDDEPEIAAILADHFKDTHEVSAASNGNDALGAILTNRPDVVLLDINMPGMDGVEVLKAIKQIDEAIAVVMVTANEDVLLAGDALKSGAFAYVPKPFDFRYLDHMMSAVLDQAKKRRR